MANSRYNPEQITLSRKERLFIRKEASYGAVTEPANADLVRVLGNPSFKQKPDFRENKEVRDTRSPNAKVRGRVPHGVFSIQTYLKPSGTGGIDPIPAAAIEGVFGAKGTRAADTVQFGTGAVDSFDVATPANFNVGEPVLVQVGTHYELVRLTGKVGAKLSVAPDLPAVPADGAVVGAAVKFTLADDLPSYNVWRDLGHTVILYTGCVFDKFGLGINGQDEVIGSFGGGYQREIRTGTSKLAADVAAAGTLVITVEDGSLFSIGSRINLSDGINTETKAVVTDKDGDDLTVTRGTGAQAWTAADGVDVYPWLPVGTDAGHIIQGRRGAAHLNGVATSIMSADLDLDGKVHFHEDEKTGSGSDYVESYSTPGVRDVKLKLSVLFRQKNLSLFAASDDITVEELWIPAYVMDSAKKPVPGKVLAVMLPETQFETPDIGEKDGDRLLSIEVNPYDSAGANKELALWFL